MYHGRPWTSMDVHLAGDPTASGSSPCQCPCASGSPGSPSFAPVTGSQTAARQVNALQVLTRFEVGRRIVEHEQGGEARAGNGRAVLQTLSEALTEEFGRGWSVDNLTLMRRFYLSYRDTGLFSETVSRISEESSRPTPETLSRISGPRFTLSWSHYVVLMAIEDVGHVRMPEEGPTVGIILCKQNREALVEITLPEEANIHAREYQLVLPSKADLRAKLLEWTGGEST